MTPGLAPLGLYIHWPFCARICPYCDFNVYRARGETDTLLASMLRDLEGQARQLEREGMHRPLVSLHFGGGTPSLMRPHQIAALIEAADRWFGFEDGLEIGLEANPKEAAGFADIVAAGVNRLSLGVQSFDDDVLRRLGRDHDGNSARRALDTLLALDVRHSVDLIYAWAGQSLDDWVAEMDALLVAGVRHVSPYQLTIEPGTAFGKRADRGELLIVDEDEGARFFEVTQSVLSDGGVPAYEISNHAASASDQSRHNRLYWEGADWLGLGPGAHGRWGEYGRGGRRATAALRRPADYIARVSQAGTGLGPVEILSPKDEAAERILMGLRTTDGLDRDLLRAKTRHDIDTDTSLDFARQGLVSLSQDRIALTPAGRLYADRIAQELVPE